MRSVNHWMVLNLEDTTTKDGSVEKNMVGHSGAQS